MIVDAACWLKRCLNKFGDATFETWEPEGRALEQYEDRYHGFDQITDDREYVDLVEDVYHERDFQYGGTIRVCVQRWQIVNHLLYDAPTAASCYNVLGDEPIIFISKWAADRLPEDDLRDIIAHELCHVEVTYCHSDHEEDDEVFEDMVRSKDSLMTLEECASVDDADEFWEPHPHP